ncbi:hypothetical protein CYY_009630 [Polysphondylium violaceum]|uniref:Uncharacterized protein n=1 Tax=Polysphondylium violaceum TaxID=133409 RepID=A0A8J4PMJ0_9MYCE|nr:hypothetical protein CYY_009630 [Polysphondylium violaceum]
MSTVAYSEHNHKKSNKTQYFHQNHQQQIYNHQLAHHQHHQSPTKYKTTMSHTKNKFNTRMKSPPSQNINFWAGGAFTNSPSPNSLPLPNFDDELATLTTTTSHTPITLEQMSFDLRRLLNIPQSVLAGSPN